ncbi:MAG: GTP-binding protein [Deltaproteobacteria bacterium]|nr:MAG: GTP-binding protein [Deltaproteobacteria bacterium]
MVVIRPLFFRWVVKITGPVELEGAIDFPEDIDPPEDADGRIEEVEKELSEVLSQWSRKRTSLEKVVICGRTNVGKSTLANALSGEEMSIVTGRAGTTRDAVERRVMIGRAEIILVDTAGFMEGEKLDEIDEAAIGRTRRVIEEASVVIWVSEAGKMEEPDDGTAADLRVLNKVDTAGNAEVERAERLGWICVSAKYGLGLDRLQQRLVKLLEQRAGRLGGLPVSARRYDFLEKSLESLGRARDNVSSGSLELASADLSDAIESLYRVLGRKYDPDVLEEIFSGFCVGK